MDSKRIEEIVKEALDEEQHAWRVISGEFPDYIGDNAANTVRQLCGYIGELVIAVNERDASIAELRAQIVDLQRDIEQLTASDAEADARIGRLLADIASYKSAISNARLNNPYSITAFTPVSNEQWVELASIIGRELGHSIDRYAAALMVDAWDRCTRTIEEMGQRNGGCAMKSAAWMYASIEELRMLYADRLSDLEYEYCNRRAAEGQVAELQAQVAELQRRVSEHESNAAGRQYVIEQCNADIDKLLAQNAELQAKVNKCKCTDDFGNVTQ